MVVLLQFLVVGVEVAKFVGEDVGIGHEIEILFSKLFLHSHDIEAQPVLPGDFVRLREMVDLLVLIEALVKVRFAVGSSPQHVPLVRLSLREPVRLQNGP